MSVIYPTAESPVDYIESTPDSAEEEQDTIDDDTEDVDEENKIDSEEEISEEVIEETDTAVETESGEESYDEDKIEIMINRDTNIIGKANASEEQLLSLFEKRNSTKMGLAEELAKLYIEWGNKFNIRYDIAWAQMCHETGFLEFEGIVPPEANNFCGLGASGEKDEDGNYIYNSFETVELGVIAHYAHLAWYIYPEHLDLEDADGDLYCSDKYDPRHFGEEHNYNGESNIGALEGRWATSDWYIDKIIEFANEIYE
ncbi:hypothetical protein ES707_03692 [subsurface metagenome]